MSGTPMKLILTQEVDGLGAPGEVVEVAGGYGRNYLVPRGLAMRWTRGAEKQIELIKRARSVHEIKGLGDARDAASTLGSLTVRLERRAGSGGRLFGSISPADIAAAVRAGDRSRDRAPWKPCDPRIPYPSCGARRGGWPSRCGWLPCLGWPLRCHFLVVPPLAPGSGPGPLARVGSGLRARGSWLGI